MYKTWVPVKEKQRWEAQARYETEMTAVAPRLKAQKKPVAVDKPPVVKRQLSEEELELKRKNDRERKRKSRANGGVEKKEEENSKKRTKRANLDKVQLDEQREKERQQTANHRMRMSPKTKETKNKKRRDKNNSDRGRNIKRRAERRNWSDEKRKKYNDKDALRMKKCRDEMKEEKAARSSKKRPSRAKYIRLADGRIVDNNTFKRMNDGRSINAANRDWANGSLYFYHPDGKGLRSTGEIEQYKRRSCLKIQKWWKGLKLKKLIRESKCLDSMGIEILRARANL